MGCQGDFGAFSKVSARTPAGRARYFLTPEFGKEGAMKRGGNRGLRGFGRTCVIAAAVVTAGAANMAADDLCGATITTDLKLEQDLSCAGNGLTVGADGIKLHLNGYTISGSGSGVGITVIGRTGVSISGGTVRNFTTGVLVMNSTTVVIKDNRIVDNGGDGVDLQAGSVGNTVKENYFEGNLARGIMLRGNTSANQIKENTFTGNRVGILVFGTSGATVKENTLSSNLLAAIRVNVIATGNLLAENIAISNPAGIEFLITPTGSSTGNTLRENTLALNTCGLKGPLAGNTLTENVFQGNTADTCP